MAYLFSHRDSRGTPIDNQTSVRQNMMEIINIVGLVVIVCIAWMVWTERKSKQALDKDVLDQAWREDPDEPLYADRHHYEERKRVVDQARADAAGR
jgi:FtsZ-interacting cell division protein ZipA